METIDILRFQLTGLSFLLVILPLLLLVYYLFPQRWRPAALLAESLLIYHFGALGNIWVMLASIAADYFLLRLMDICDRDEGRRRICLLAAVGKGLLLLVWMGLYVRANNLPQLIGISVYTLSGFSCLAAAFRREIPCECDPVRFALYCSFFPKLYAGTMHPYGDYVRQLREVHLHPGNMLTGAGQAIQGAFKAAVFGSGLFGVSQAAAVLPPTALAAWLRVFAFAFAFYYVLSGYSDMAQGIGAMFGLSIPRNFYYPYQSRNVQDFFARFHITVSTFLRDVFRWVLGGWKNRRAADMVGTLLTCILVGAWFGMRASYLLWGAYFALLIVLERYLYPKLLENIPTLFCRIGTLCLVLAGFTIFLVDNPLESLGLVRTMFSFGDLLDDSVLYLLTSNWLLLLLSCFFATNAVNLAVVKLRRAAPAFAAALFGLIDLAVLVLYLALSI